MSTRGSGDVALITGATGFLGGQLTLELLRRTGKTVRCLVRGRTQEGAEARLHAGLTALGLTASELRRNRLGVIRGDLSEDRLGLSAADYDDLSSNLDSVYHCAASVNLAASYDSLHAANVGGTRAIIELVANARQKTLHYVSSLGVFLDSRSGGHSEVDERTEPTPQTAGEVGYARTKAEAEAEVSRAAISAVIYRPGLIIADSRTGRSPETDLLVRLVRAATALSVAPACAGEVPVSTVDFVARTIVDISLRRDAVGGVFHPIRPEPFRLRELFDHLGDYGLPLESVPVAEWKLRLAQNRRRPEAFLISAIWPFTSFMLATDGQHSAPAVRSANTWAFLGSSNPAHPPLDRAYFNRMFDHVTQRPAPRPPGQGPLTR